MTTRKDMPASRIPEGSTISTYADNTAWVVTPTGKRHTLRSLAEDPIGTKISHCESCGKDVSEAERDHSVGLWGHVFCAFCVPAPRVPTPTHPAKTVFDATFCPGCKGSGCACHFGVDGHPQGLIGWSPCRDCDGTGRPPVIMNVGDTPNPVVPLPGDGGEEITTC